MLQVYVQPRHCEAQHFLDHFARCDATANDIPTVTHIVEVKLTALEHAIYLGQVQRNAPLEQRVMLCNHYSMEDRENDSAEKAVERTKSAQKEQLAATSAHLTGAEKALEDNPDERGLAISAGAARNGVRQAEAAIRFFEATLSCLQETSFSAQCAVCWDDMKKETTCLLTCGHLFCKGCVGLGKCPSCRAAVERKINVSELLTGEAEAEHGSKIMALVRVTKTIEDDKMLVFVQWEALSLKIQRALKQCGVQALRLRGSTTSRTKTLQEFACGSAKLLLLSLEKSPTGMNLTCANHVVLFHPMVAESEEIARDYERQAVGRVKRHGQTKTVHVHRVVAKGTIEEDLL